MGEVSFGDWDDFHEMTEPIHRSHAMSEGPYLYESDDLGNQYAVLNGERILDDASGIRTIVDELNAAHKAGVEEGIARALDVVRGIHDIPDFRMAEIIEELKQPPGA